jgi:hypothetical protein
VRVATGRCRLAAGVFVLAGRLRSLWVAGSLRVVSSRLRSRDSDSVSLRVALFSDSDSLGDVSGSGCTGRDVDSHSGRRGAVLRNNRSRWVGHWSTSGVDWDGRSRWVRNRGTSGVIGDSGSRWVRNWSTSRVDGDVRSGNRRCRTRLASAAVDG